MRLGSKPQRKKILAHQDQDFPGAPLQGVLRVDRALDLNYRRFVSAQLSQGLSLQAIHQDNQRNNITNITTEKCRFITIHALPMLTQFQVAEYSQISLLVCEAFLPCRYGKEKWFPSLQTCFIYNESKHQIQVCVQPTTRAAFQRALQHPHCRYSALQSWGFIQTTAVSAQSPFE